MSRRFLIACWPFTGHVVPQLSIAAALRDRGHTVTFYTGAAARPLLESAGFDAFPLSAVDERAVTAAVRALEHGAGRGRPRIADVQRCFRTWLVDSIPGQLSDLSQLMTRCAADAIVCDVAMWGPSLVLAETSAVPVALSTIFMGPPLRTPEVPPAGLGLPSPSTRRRALTAAAAQRATDLLARGLRREVDAVRAVHGLAALERPVNDQLGRLPLTLVPSLRELDYGRSQAPPGVHYVGECRWQRPASAGAGDWSDQVPGDRPWVHVSATAMEGADPFILRAAAHGLAGAPVEVIATTGGAAVAPEFAPDTLAANVHVAPWVDHDRLLPRCAAVVTAGGTGTIVAALAAGVPLVIVPTTWDKPDNARRVVEAGVGIRLAPRRCTPQRLAQAVTHVLGDPHYRLNAQRYAGLLASAPGPTGAAQLLERLAAGRAPSAVSPATPGGVA